MYIVVLNLLHVTIIRAAITIHIHTNDRDVKTDIFGFFASKSPIMAGKDRPLHHGHAPPGRKKFPVLGLSSSFLFLLVFFL